MMAYWVFWMVMLAVWGGVHMEVVLTQKGSEIKRPSESVQLTCATRGFVVTDYWMAWVRQKPGKGLEWLAWYRKSSETKYYSPTIHGRFTASKASSNFYLQMNTLKVEDTAVYYCSKQDYSGSYDYWGQGTFVTVTTESPTAPSLFPLIPSDNTISGDITIGCLAKDFLPDSLTLSWQKPNNDSLEASKFRRFPSIANSNGVYTTSSEATIPASQWEASEPFYCKAEHSSQTRVARVVRQAQNCLDPEIIIRVPLPEDFQGEPPNSTLLCKVSNLHTERTTIKWLLNGEMLASGFTTSAPTKQVLGGYSIISELVVTKKDWYSGKTFSCHMQNEKYNEIRNASKPSDSQGCDVPNVRVETIPPTFLDIYMTSSANLTCRISNLPFGQDGNLDVTWIQEKDNKALETVIGQPQEQENKALAFVDAVATICRTDWESGANYQCIVRHPLLASTERKSLKIENGNSRNPPSVYLLPPPPEQLAMQETATITCLMKNFYPSDFFVKWMRNNEPVATSEYYTSKPIQESKSPERYFTSSMLNVPEQEWSNGDTFTCLVGHKELLYQTTQKTIDKNTAYLDGIVVIDDDEGLLNISSILSTFIILFLVSLFYGATVTVIKVK